MALLLALTLFFAAGSSVYASYDAEREVMENLPESAVGIVDGNTQSALDRLWDYAGSHARDMLGEALGCACRVMACIIMASCVSCLFAGRGMDYVSLGTVLGIAAISLTDAAGLVKMGQETVNELKTFADILMPAMCTAAAAAGAVSSAGAKYAASAMFLDILVNLLAYLIFPLICAYLAAVTANAALPEGNLGGVSKLLRRACVLLLSLTVSGFTLYLSLTGIVASSADAFTTKAAKTAISAALPVVGSIISDAAGSIVAGAGVIRSTVGIVGLLAVGAVCIIPVLRLGLRYLVFKAVAALGEMCADKRIAALVDGIADAYGMILGTVGAETAMIYISVISLLKAVGT